MKILDQYKEFLLMLHGEWEKSYKKYPPLVVVAKGAYVDSIKASSCGA